MTPLRLGLFRRSVREGLGRMRRRARHCNVVPLSQGRRANAGAHGCAAGLCSDWTKSKEAYDQKILSNQFIYKISSFGCCGNPDLKLGIADVKWRRHESEVHHGDHKHPSTQRSVAAIQHKCTEQA